MAITRTLIKLRLDEQVTVLMAQMPVEHTSPALPTIPKSIKSIKSIRPPARARDTTPVPQIGYAPLTHVEIAHPGILAIFQALPRAKTAAIMSQMERRERIVFMLLDGKRSISDVSRLTHHTELEVVRIIVRLLKSEFIEYLRG